MSQVQECIALLLQLAKSTSIPILAINHVTKTGNVAGPRMVEHMVNAVLYIGRQRSILLRAIHLSMAAKSKESIWVVSNGRALRICPRTPRPESRIGWRFDVAVGRLGRVCHVH